jgi:hypothetical protein
MTQRFQYLMTPDVLRLRTVQRDFSDALKKEWRKEQRAAPGALGVKLKKT